MSYESPTLHYYSFQTCAIMNPGIDLNIFSVSFSLKGSRWNIQTFFSVLQLPPSIQGIQIIQDSWESILIISGPKLFTWFQILLKIMNIWKVGTLQGKCSLPRRLSTRCLNVPGHWMSMKFSVRYILQFLGKKNHLIQIDQITC